MTAPGPLDGAVSMVTGGASGIGLACAMALAGRGSTVGVCDLDLGAARHAVEEIEAAGGRAAPIALDVSDPVSVERGVADVVACFGPLGIAVNSAGVGAPAARLADSAPADWDRVIGVNLTGMYHSLRAEIVAMRAAGGGAIVNIGSVLSVTASRSGSAAYVASKHGVAGLTKQAAADHADEGVRVNVVLPGYVNTTLLDARLDEDQKKSRAAAALLGRLAEPAEVASLVVWLASGESSFVTGAQFAVDGGYTTL